MGAWGTELYASDFGQDMRDSVKAVARLPFEPARLLDYLCATEPRAANDSQDPDHAVFWLTVADQFNKRGIDCTDARDRALAIIAKGSDLAAMARLGMGEKSLAKRGAMLQELRARLGAPIAATKLRSVLKGPQKLLLEPGEVVIYPVCQGKPINPYTVGKDFAFVKAWRQDGFGAFMVAERGLVFDHLAWYRPLVICEPLAEEPRLSDLFAPRRWLMRNPGTLTPRHFANMALRSLGRVVTDAAKLDRIFPERMSAHGAAVSDISIANNITVQDLGPHEAHRVKHGYPPTPRIQALADIVAV